MKLNKALRSEGFYGGRTITYSKSEYRAANPNSVVYYSAGIITLSGGHVWGGDLDLTKDSDALKRVSAEIGEELYILREQDTYYDEKLVPLSDVIKKAIWDTTKSTPVK